MAGKVGCTSQARVFLILKGASTLPDKEISFLEQIRNPYNKYAPIKMAEGLSSVNFSLGARTSPPASRQSLRKELGARASCPHEDDHSASNK